MSEFLAQLGLCPNCGSEISAQYTYCMNCGKKLGQNDLNQNKTDNYSQTRERRSIWKNKTMRNVIAAILVAVVIISSIIFIIGPWMINILDLRPYDYLGTTTYTVDDITPVTKLNLRINCLSPINISFREDLQVLLEAKIIVYGKPGHSLDNSDKFEGALENEIYDVWFEPYYGDLIPKGYEYELYVNISTQILTSLEVDSGYGDLFVVAHGANISNVMLSSSWGKVTVQFQETVILNSEALYIDSTKESVDVTLINMSYSNNYTYWGVSSSEGNVSVGIYQKGSMERNQNVTFRITASEGEVMLKHDLSSSIGYMIENAWLIDVDFSFIGYPPNVLLPYFSENYSDKSTIYKFELAGTEGVTIISLS